MKNFLDKYKYDLLGLKNPGRYVGGDFGSLLPKGDENLRVCISFPDLYEIGMSNQALKILYNQFNSIKKVYCERVFAPEQDLEDYLREGDLSLFSLETQRPVRDFDILAFTIGYELCLTNLLNILELSNIPIYNIDRSENDPIVICGGPATTNPISFGSLVDFVCIAEAEAVYDDLLARVSSMKSRGATRSDIIEYFRTLDYMWYKGRETRVKRALWWDFGSVAQQRTHLPVPSIKPVQDHGVVEIMRGCPNGCRFCHAGVYYKPFRQKDFKHIVKEVDDLVNICGYRNITLSSLSSGDYGRIHQLIQGLNLIYKDKNVSFSLPSLRVNSVSLPLLEELSQVRKSGLTFAVETPTASGQRGINKEVPRSKIIELLNEAKERGWRLAKFYFMLGIPVDNGEDEAGEIINYIREIQRETGLKINVNIGVYIPKPHTTFQRARQLTDQEGFKELIRVKNELKGKHIKVSFHSPFLSFLEGIVTRGDDRSSEIIVNAYKKGARFDAWDEHINKDLWKEVISEADWDVEKEICRERAVEEKLPWDNITLLETNAHRQRELEKANSSQLTNLCSIKCDHNCGICKKDNKVRVEEDDFDFSSRVESYDRSNSRRIIFKFAKRGKAIFIPHLSTMTIIERAFFRAGIDVVFTEGFNPKPRLEFAHPLTMGIESEYEIFVMDMYSGYENLEGTIDKLNKGLPEGFEILKGYPMNPHIEGRKKKKLMALYAGSKYQIGLKNSSYTSQELIEKIEKFNSENDLSNEYEITFIDNENFMLKAIFNNKALNNPVKLLTEITGNNPLTSGIDLRRDTMYAKSKKGTLILFSDVK